MKIDWEKYSNFSKREFDCSHTGHNKMRSEFIDILQEIRSTYARPMRISSGYRHPTHPAERQKKIPGEHTYGIAADVLVSGHDALDLICAARGLGLTRIGINQRGPYSSRFIHIGIGDMLLDFPSVPWTY